MAVPSNVVGGVADSKYGKQQQMHGTRSRTDDEIGSRNRAGEAFT